MQITMKHNIPNIDIENVFLKHFRQRNAEPNVRDGFVGIGMLLDALVRFAYASRDNDLIRLKSCVTEELLKTQDADGYIGIFIPEMRMQGWDTHEGGYIILALVSDYTCFQNKKSLDAARRYADLLIEKQVTWITGLEDAFLALYQATHDSKYLDYCLQEFGLAEFRGGSVHHSRHVYGFVERCLMQLKLYQICPEEKLLYKPHVAVELLVNLDAMDIIGSAGVWEHFDTNQQGNECNAETCATAYIIRLLHHLLQIEGNAFYGDIMERSIYNALFAAQSPDGRQIRYFTDYESAKEYYPDDYFCCPNNFRRMIADLPEMIYYQTDSGIFVNLYNQSQAKVVLNGQKVVIEQITDYPSSERVIIKLHPAEKCEFTVALRIPLWCKNPQVQINGSPADGFTDSSQIYTQKRIWQEGDEITLTLPMAWRLIEGKHSQWNKVALMRGPIVYTMSNRVNEFLTNETDIMVDAESISEPVEDHSCRPGGLRCSARIVPGNNEIVFTEFIDPTGIKTFFRVSDGRAIKIADEFMTKHY
ncbi:MAG: hypothetical protein EHM72_15035 [Calditrichaeota bacterium]|nr:MAG: hypothetical protein EHM72_15035 [Calditrichota bacterium]